MVNANFKILVGGMTNDNSHKDDHKRMDRVTLTYPITSTTTLIANPLGGALYILVPYRAALGCVARRSSSACKADAEWLVAWATFETDLHHGRAARVREGRRRPGSGRRS